MTQEAYKEGQKPALSCLIGIFNVVECIRHLIRQRKAFLPYIGVKILPYGNLRQHKAAYSLIRHHKAGVGEVCG